MAADVQEWLVTSAWSLPTQPLTPYPLPHIAITIRSKTETWVFLSHNSMQCLTSCSLLLPSLKELPRRQDHEHPMAALVRGLSLTVQRRARNSKKLSMRPVSSNFMSFVGYKPLACLPPPNLNLPRFDRYDGPWSGAPPSSKPCCRRGC